MIFIQCYYKSSNYHTVKSPVFEMFHEIRHPIFWFPLYFISYLYRNAGKQLYLFISIEMYFFVKLNFLGNLFFLIHFEMWLKFSIQNVQVLEWNRRKIYFSQTFGQMLKGPSLILSNLHISVTELLHK